MDTKFFLYIILLLTLIAAYGEDKQKKIVIYNLIIKNEKMAMLKQAISQQQLDKIKAIRFINRKYRLGVYFSK
ncbi:hypothetical protein H1220_08040 [Carnobacteriaceae bacterium zg-84]|uniref:hypothetical protein n=1 Tax=Granulicatella sp. zg-84 TaxID=2678503 RepID=UPI0013C22E13|nr:hypothetical protein [Granulicatella sp. zg-84]NEW66288.1 hypothetical protein [Granulicatella sp. zg-84]QMI85625.1 hypothetical protein H1220_08040 [Carnobacteriaceae bacterium zg-84]